MITFCFGFAFVTFLCLFIASFGFLICGSENPNVRFCMYFTLIITALTLGCMFWVQETHPEMFQSPVSKLINCPKPGKVI